jgi:hypothetical protein
MSPPSSLTDDIPLPQEISTLLTLISTATRTAVAEYRQSFPEHEVPVPGGKEVHPMDGVTDAIELRKAIRLLEGACERLCTTLAQPMHTMVNASR